jgi:hypothetical protein
VGDAGGCGAGEGVGVAAGGAAEGLPNNCFIQPAIACSIDPMSQSSVRASVSENTLRMHLGGLQKPQQAVSIHQAPFFSFFLQEM